MPTATASMHGDENCRTESPLPEEAETSVLTRALAGGDNRAWRDFHDQYRGRLRAWLTPVWHGPEEALDDILQDTFLRAARNMRVFGDEEALWCWLTVLARSATMDFGRKRGRWRRLLDLWVTDAPSPRPPEDERLGPAMARMPAEEASLIRMKYEDSLSVREIAASLGLTEKAVEARLSRARQNLKLQLGKDS